MARSRTAAGEADETGSEHGEDATVEQTIEKAPGIDAGTVVGAPIVQSTTEETPSPADETPMPNHLNTEHEQPPVRSSRPDTPLAQTLAAGAGAHTPPDPEVWGPDGRLRDNPADEG